MDDSKHTGDSDRCRKPNDCHSWDEPPPWNCQFQVPPRSGLELAYAGVKCLRSDGPSRSELLGELVEAVVYELKRRHRRSPPVPASAGLG
jgi:hypothetical protein